MGTTPIVPNSAVDSVSSVLALQEVDESNLHLRARRRGDEILDRLDEIRHGLLLGSISRQTLEHLEQAVRTKVAESGDSKLTEVLREIEVRARVELAKLERQS